MSQTATRRLVRDLECLQKSNNPQLRVLPSSSSMLEWHFVLNSLPDDTPYGGGCYHGKIIFPKEYPHSPPSILMLTPSGRLQINRRLCLSMTDFHPESWNPAWSVETILLGLLSFMVSGDEATAYGAVRESEERRRQLAQESWAFNAQDAEFAELFPDLLQPPTGAVSSSSTTPGVSVTPLAESRSPAPEAADVIAAAPGGEAAHVDQLEAFQLNEALYFSTREAPPSSQTGSLSEASDAQRQAPPSADSVSESDSVSGDCTICREPARPGDPLIQPCACRGSMSGVHASCVEAWVSHHRRRALNDQPPRCSVCNQPYRGRDVPPGPVQFVRHAFLECSRQFLRSVLLIGLSVGFLVAVASDEHEDLVLRIGLIAAFVLVGAHKIAVITVSLPPNRLPPVNRCARRFFVGDLRILMVHIAESFTVLCFLCWCCVVGDLPVKFFWPVGAAALIPVVKVLGVRQPSLACLLRVLGCVGLVVMCPYILLSAALKYAWHHPRRLVNPLEGPPHVAVSIAAVLLLFFAPSSVPVLVLWGVHSVLLMFCLAERAFIKRLAWVEGQAWWFAMHFAMIATYTAVILGLDLRPMSKVIICSSLCWLTLHCALVLSVNWSLCVRYYRTWQHRNGTFTLGESRSTEPLV